MPLNSVGLIVDQLIGGIGSISSFIEAAEKVIYNPDEIDEMDSQSLLELYSAASKRQVQIIDLARKLMKDNKGESAYSEEIMAMASLLSGLNQENLGELRKFMSAHKMHNA